MIPSDVLSTPVFAHMQTGKCIVCKMLTCGINSPPPRYCDTCKRAADARRTWGGGDDGDRLIAFHEGPDVLERLRIVEQTEIRLNIELGRMAQRLWEPA